MIRAEAVAPTLAFDPTPFRGSKQTPSKECAAPPNRRPTSPLRREQRWRFRQIRPRRPRTPARAGSARWARPTAQDDPEQRKRFLGDCRAESALRDGRRAVVSRRGHCRPIRGSKNLRANAVRTQGDNLDVRRPELCDAVVPRATTDDHPAICTRARRPARGAHRRLAVGRSRSVHRGTIRQRAQRSYGQA